MNTLKTYALLAIMTALFGGIGLLLGGVEGMAIALVIAAVLNIGSWWFSDRMVLGLYGAKEIRGGPVYTMTRELVRRAAMPMPRVYIIESGQPNAFATGRNPENGAVAVTSGLMNLVNERELRGVIAHELAHIQNRDTLIMTITATIAGSVSMLANFALFFGGARDRLGLIGTIAVMILAPIAAALVQMAISRVREYSADRDGARMCGDPMALASALQKLERGASRIDNHVAEQNPATAHMFIINPLHMRQMDNLFSTHPNTQNRIKELEVLAKRMTGSEPAAAPTKTVRNNPWN